MRNSRAFNQEVFDASNADGIDRLVGLCEQRGIPVLSVDDLSDPLYENGDVCVNLGTGSDLFEAEMRGIQSDPPWVPDPAQTDHFVFKYLADGVSVVGRKVENSKAVLQVSFYGSNATILLMADARKGVKAAMDARGRGEDTRSYVRMGLVLVIHQDAQGVWHPCPRGQCNSEDDTPSQRKIREIFWPESIE